MTGAIRRSLTVLTAGAVGLLAPLPYTGPTPAQAATCSGGGVSVVVDYGVYGGVDTGCAGSPGNGLAALAQAGFPTVQVTSQPGFVCRIDGLPPVGDDACVVTPPTTAYWSYWQAGPGGSWVYSSRGAANTAPDSGDVEGWAFGAGNPPSTPPPSPAPAPTTTRAAPPPTPAPTRTPTTRAPAPTGSSRTPAPPSVGPGPAAGSPGAIPPAGPSPADTSPPGPGPSASGTSTATSGPATGATPGGSPDPTGPTTPDAGAAPSAGAAAPGTPGEGPPWVALVGGLAVLGLAVGAYGQARRRRSGP